MKANHYEIGVGATAEFSLRVSVATLVRVLFKNPSDGKLMLALERKATLHETEKGRIVEVKSQPLGGAIRIRDLNLMRSLFSDFHFDSEHSRVEQDFRIFIRPSEWPALREFCLQHISSDDDPILETNPRRELNEELADALKINLKSEQYVCIPVATLVKNEATSTNNFYSKGSPTVRVYRTFEASITDSHLIDVMLKNSENISDQDLCKLAWTDFHNGGNGWANAISILSLKGLTNHHLSVLFKEHNKPFLYEKNLLDDSVSAILEGIPVPKYRRL